MLPDSRKIVIPFEKNEHCWIGLVRVVALFGVVTGFVFSTATGVARPLPQETDERPLQQQYDEIVAKWRDAAKNAAVAGGKFYVASREESTDIEKKWREAIDEGSRQLALLKPVAIELFRTTPRPNDDMVQLMIRFMEQDLSSGLYDSAFEISELLLSKDLTESETVERIMKSRAALSVFTNRFELAKEIKVDHGYVIEELPLRARSFYYGDLDSLQTSYARELELREKEKASDDLPRVEIKTSKGTIVIELFENEAPNTVGNFISLVEKHTYDGMIFHRVINDFMAQTGGFNVHGQRAIIGYTIYDECKNPDTRRHFRGSVSMAKTTDPDSGNSQFFIDFVPTPMLDFEHTVFGRVISGWDALDRLNRTHTITDEGEEEPIATAVPDQVISARVLRKRDHEYKPDIVK
jgi:cyclophilin family peptidyl-prolyl cis-trans isomerase